MGFLLKKIELEEEEGGKPNWFVAKFEEFVEERWCLLVVTGLTHVPVIAAAVEGMVSLF